MLFILAGVVLLLATRTLADSTIKTIPYDAIYKTNLPETSSKTMDERSKQVGSTIRSSQTHSIRASKTISEEALRQYLAAKDSPLVSESSGILSSPYWSTIIGICTIEQRNCASLPGGNNWNLWGIGGASGLKFYATAEEGITAINTWLANHEAKHPTIESLNCYYVQPCSSNWLRIVINTKNEVENYAIPSMAH